MAQFFGEGDWTPNPKHWQKSNAIKVHPDLFEGGKEDSILIG